MPKHKMPKHKMPKHKMPKNIYMYKAANVPIAVLVYRGKEKGMWRMVKWDIRTDTFTEGPWIKEKNFCQKKCAISADGTMFAYQHCIDLYICSVPNWTEVIAKEKNFGSWNIEGFLPDGSLATKCEKDWEVNESSPVKIVKSSEEVKSGYVRGRYWKDLSGRKIILTNGKVCSIIKVLYDSKKQVLDTK